MHLLCRGQKRGDLYKCTGVQCRKPVPTQDKFCQVCYRLAPPVPAGQKRGYKWRQRFATTKGVRLDAHCNLRMCDRCFSDNWDHDSQCLKAGAKRHYTPKSGAGQGVCRARAHMRAFV